MGFENLFCKISMNNNLIYICDFKLFVITPQPIESLRAHSPRQAAGLASKNSNSYGIEESSLAARFFNVPK